jgi:hypothetical protein
MGKYNDISSDILNKLPSGTPNGIGITAEKHREVETSILNFIESQWVIGDIKEVDCTDTYIGNNFDSNGAGIIDSEREGWQICNGNNGTPNLVGRVCIAYGNNMTIGESGGSKDAVVLSHTHGYSSHFGTNYAEDDTNGGHVTTTGWGESTYNTTNASNGVPGTNKNMQPYIVTLFIQKVS